MAITVEQIVKYLESKFDNDFDYEVEHWENGNFDDSFEYGYKSGHNVALDEILHFIKSHQPS